MVKDTMRTRRLDLDFGLKWVLLLGVKVSTPRVYHGKDMIDQDLRICLYLFIACKTLHMMYREF